MLNWLPTVLLAKEAAKFAATLMHNVLSLHCFGKLKIILCFKKTVEHGGISIPIQPKQSYCVRSGHLYNWCPAQNLHAVSVRNAQVASYCIPR